MIKTNDIIQLKGKTMYFNKVILTKYEIYKLYVYGHCLPSFLKQIVVNTNDVNYIIDLYKSKRKTSKESFEYLINKWSFYKDEIYNDLLKFSNGELDLLDLSVKYSFYYYNVKKAFKIILDDVDVDFYWKKHKEKKQKTTCLSLYGVDNASKLKTVQEKQINTVQSRYGVLNIMKHKDFKEKLKNTMMSKYGVSTNLLLDDDVFSFSKKIYTLLSGNSKWLQVLQSIANVNKTNIDSLFKIVPIYRRDFVISTKITNNIVLLLENWFNITGEKVKYPDNIFFQIPVQFNSTFIKFYKDLNLINVPVHFESFKSHYENMIGNWLDSLNIEYINNTRVVLDGLEIDFYIPEKRLGIEINPSSSHNSNLYATNRSIFGLPKDKLYHYYKYKKAEEQNILLIQLYEYDLDPIQFENKTKHFLLQKIQGFNNRFYARNTIVSEVRGKDRSKCINFLNKYHLQNASKANTYLSMSINDELIGVASFVKHDDYIELKRLAFKYYNQVVGGLSKFLSFYFSLDKDCLEIRSFSDNNIGDGRSYMSAGGKLLKEIKTSLRFVSPDNGLDNYSWQIATKWGASKGLLSHYSKNLKTQEDIDKFIELELPHRFDDKKGYDRVYVVGSKLWQFLRQK